MMEVKLISITENAEEMIQLAARTCYSSRDKIYSSDRATFLRRLKEMGHLSVFEHAWASFDISGISRACSHQLVRHRIASYSQRSQRYVSEQGFDYVIPPKIEELPEAKKLFIEEIKRMHNGYSKLISLGIPREDARFILPNACTTHLVMTANFREWLHILSLRLKKSAQWEIRTLMEKILGILKEKAPAVFGDLKP
jgi:thymidylate synthase (FAD)